VAGERLHMRVLYTSEIVMAQYVGVARSVVKGLKYALYCCLHDISYTDFCTNIPLVLS
jgi:hypothetical protein